MSRVSSAMPRVVLWLIVLVLLAVTGVTLWQIGAFRPTPRIGLVTPDRSQFWEDAILGAQRAAEEYRVVLEVRQAEGREPGQSELVSGLMDQGVNALAISPLEANRQGLLLRRIGERIPLVTLDSDSPLSGRLCFIGADNYTAGRMCAELVREALPEGGSVVISMGSTLKDNGRLRRQGVIDELLERSFGPGRPADPLEDVLRGPLHTVAATLVDENDPAQAKQNVLDLLASGQTPDCIVALYGYSGPAVVEALAEAGRSGDVVVIGFDYADETIQAIEEGKMYASIAQDPYNYGYHAVRILSEELAGETFRSIPITGIIDVRCFTIRADNLEQFSSRLEERRAGAVAAAR